MEQRVLRSKLLVTERRLQGPVVLRFQPLVSLLLYPQWPGRKLSIRQIPQLCGCSKTAPDRRGRLMSRKDRPSRWVRTRAQRTLAARRLRLV
jgi:hypothetical protein